MNMTIHVRHRVVHGCLDGSTQISRFGDGCKVARVGLLGDGLGNLAADVADLAEGGVKTVDIHISRRHFVRQGASRNPHHVVCNVLDTGNNNAKPNPRKDVGIVALSRHVRLAVHHNRVKGAPARKQRIALGPSVGLLRGALSEVRRVGQREDDGALVHLRHQGNDGFVKNLGLGAHANDPSRLDRLEHFKQRLDRFVLVSVIELVVLQLRKTRLDNKPLGVNKKAFPPSLLNTKTLRNHLSNNQIRNPSPSLACSHENKRLVLDPRALDPHGLYQPA
mmetsp:Transcript_150/g.299  ORF Transcript_150/g.299 Transcript_150/m.299 type:complete len:278 (-) Transcript_150:874-1707(-)